MSAEWDKAKKRTHLCGEISASLQGQSILLNGWIKNMREHGQILFADLMDESGLVQITFDTKDSKWSETAQLHYDCILSVKGKVIKRPENMQNKKIKTGEWEIQPEKIDILATAKTAPFRQKDKVNENTALQYRYLDLRRRSDLKHNLKIRHEVLQIIRKELSKKGFYEIETPILYKSTPEGARDYLVPSRNQKGHFYALPQSPQTLKQILMMSGWEKYFQIARCFRDEDLRSNRQPEFSQLDLEMSFVEEEDILCLTEHLIKTIWKHIKQEDLTDFPRMAYQTALDRFGTDKPDLRNPLELKIIDSQIIIDSKLKVLSKALNEDSLAKALFVPKLSFSRSQAEKLQKRVQSMGAEGLLWIQKTKEGFKSPIKNHTTEQVLQTLYEKGGGKEEGLCFISCGTEVVVNTIFSQLISHFGKKQNLIEEDKTKCVWITDIPYFDFDPETKKWTALHHPFSLPKEKDVPLLDQNSSKHLSKIKSRAYDLVCNGHELAGGSLRIFNPKLQKKVFSILGLSEEHIEEQFGFFLTALSYGAPPHGGIAWGIERLIMILTGADNIRDVMAFPKSSSASCLMSKAPSPIETESLKELELSISKDKLDT